MMFLPTTMEAIGGAMYHTFHAGNWWMLGVQRWGKTALQRGWVEAHNCWREARD